MCLVVGVMSLSNQAGCQLIIWLLVRFFLNKKNLLNFCFEVFFSLLLFLLLFRFGFVFRIENCSPIYTQQQQKPYLLFFFQLFFNTTFFVEKKTKIQGPVALVIFLFSIYIHKKINAGEGGTMDRAKTACNIFL